MVPDSFLDDDVPDRLVAHWSHWPGSNWRIDVACLEGAVIGCVAVDLTHDGGPYVDNLHVDPAPHRTGAGRKLMASAARNAAADGALWLTVMTDNGLARDFYRAVGGVEGAGLTEELFGVPVAALPITWSGISLTRLAENC